MKFWYKRVDSWNCGIEIEVDAEGYRLENIIEILKKEGLINE
jgi:biotin operon repressor